MAFIISLARVTVLEAVRTRLLWLAAIVAVLSLGLAQFLDQIALTESRDIQSALLAALLRVAAVFIVATFVITSTMREANDKVIDLILSLPQPRAGYFFGKFAGYALVAVLVASIIALPLLLSARPGGLAAWWASLVCELLIVTGVSLFCVLGLAQMPTACAAVAAFYFLARSMSAMQTIAGASLAHEPTLADRFIGRLVDGIGLLLPSLDQMTQTQWLLGPAPDAATLGAIAGQTLVYLALILGAGLFDLYRKSF